MTDFNRKISHLSMQSCIKKIYEFNYNRFLNIVDKSKITFKNFRI